MDAFPVVSGGIELTACERVRHDDLDGPDAFPEFVVEGTIEIDGERRRFKRRVSVELDGRDADQEHIEGFDLDDLTMNGGPNDRCGADEDLYNAIYETPAYQQAAAELNGTA